MKLTLFHKAAIWLAIPLAIQIAVACEFFKLQNEAEEQTRQEQHARKVSTTISGLIRDSLVLLTATQNDQFTLSTFSFSKYRQEIQHLEKTITTLEDLVKDDPRELAIVRQARVDFTKMQELLAQTVLAYKRGNMQDVLTTARQTHEIMKHFGVEFTGTVVQEVDRMEEDIEAHAFEKHEENRRRTRMLLVFSVAFSVACTLIFLYIFSSLVSRRLGVLMRNSFRLAKSEPLEKVLAGSDEIANLDHVLHEVGRTLIEAKRRERAVVDNALDVICSTDEKLRFKLLSPACLSVFGCSPDELEGSRLINLIVDEDANRTSELIQTMMQSDECSGTVENRVKHKDGKMVDIHWSLHWSKAEQSFFCVARDVSEMKEAERMKQEVVQMVTHDLRSPLSAIQNFFELLEIGLCGTLSPKGVNMLHAAERSGERMMRLINELLDLEKIKGGMMTLEVTVAPLMQLFEHASQAVPIKAGPDAVTIEIITTELIVECDPDRMMQVLTNLLSNAVKFSPPGDRVVLSAQKNDGLVDISVEDHGRGIPEEQLAAIFEPFQQVETSDATIKGGTGLGLAICRGIIELHGGTITVESKIGAGSTFHVTLPLTPEALQQQEKLAQPAVNNQSSRNQEKGSQPVEGDEEQNVTEKLPAER